MRITAITFGLDKLALQAQLYPSVSLSSQSSSCSTNLATEEDKQTLSMG